MAGNGFVHLHSGAFHTCEGVATTTCRRFCTKKPSVFCTPKKLMFFWRKEEKYYIPNKTWTRSCTNPWVSLQKSARQRKKKSKKGPFLYFFCTFFSRILNKKCIFSFLGVHFLVQNPDQTPPKRCQI